MRLLLIYNIQRNDLKIFLFYRLQWGEKGKNALGRDFLGESGCHVVSGSGEEYSCGIKFTVQWETEINIAFLLYPLHLLIPFIGCTYK